MTDETEIVPDVSSHTPTRGKKRDRIASGTKRVRDPVTNQMLATNSPELREKLASTPGRTAQVRTS